MQVYPSLLMGTSEGNVMFLTISMPPTPESRTLQDVSWDAPCECRSSSGSFAVLFSFYYHSLCYVSSPLLFVLGSSFSPPPPPPTHLSLSLSLSLSLCLSPHVFLSYFDFSSFSSSQHASSRCPETPSMTLQCLTPMASFLSPRPIPITTPVFGAVSVENFTFGNVHCTSRFTLVKNKKRETKTKHVLALISALRQSDFWVGFSALVGVLWFSTLPCIFSFSLLSFSVYCSWMLQFLPLKGQRSLIEITQSWPYQQSEHVFFARVCIWRA